MTKGLCSPGKRIFPGVIRKEKGAGHNVTVEGKTSGFALKELAPLGRAPVL